MHLITRLLLVTFILSQLVVSSLAQGDCDQEEGAFTCFDAPVLCDIQCLDGFTSGMPSSNIGTQPEQLCPTGGSADNMSWFSFIAGSDSIQLTIIPSNCTAGQDPVQIGIQAGIFNSCDFDVAEPLGCSESNTTQSPVTIGSSSFVPGQQYYFWVDGYAASQCTYTVRLDFGDQPFELRDFNLITSPADNSPTDQIEDICLGYERLQLTPFNFSDDVDYYWRITPPNPDYPSGQYELLSNITYWNFNYEGTYTIDVYATNNCDQTEVVSRTFNVSQIPVEDFGIDEVCENLLLGAGYEGPQGMDPNGDGVYGWQSTRGITNPGVNLNTVRLINGCEYEQTVEIDVLPNSLVNPINEVSCGPFDYNGITFHQNTQDFRTVLSGQAANGCDSLVSLSVIILDIEGVLEVGDCSAAAVEVSFLESNVDAPTGYTLNYIWTEVASGTPLVDNDSDPTNILVSSQMDLNLDIEIITTDGLSCTKTIGSVNVNPANAVPAMPLALDWETTVCDISQPQQFAIRNLASYTNIDWSVTAGASILSGQGTDIVSVDVGTSTSFDICVTVQNACGSSEPYCQTVGLLDASIPMDIDVSGVGCVDSFVTFTITSPIDPDATYRWDLGATILISGDKNRPEPVTIRFIAGGPKTVSVSASKDGCTVGAKDTTLLINVFNDAPVLNCNALANQISLSWDTEACDSEYILLRDNVEIYRGTAGAFVDDKLAQNQDYDYELRLISDCPCKEKVAYSSCRTINCTNLNATISNPTGILCSSDITPVQIALDLQGVNNINDGVGQFVGDHVSADGLFTPPANEVGDYIIFYEYSINGCYTSDQIVVSVVGSTDYDISTFDPECVDDLFGSIQLDIENQTGVQVFVDGEVVDGSIFPVNVGDHTVTIVDGNSCEVRETISINTPDVPDINVEGPLTAEEGQQMLLNVSAINSESFGLDSIDWYIDNTLFCEGADCFNMDLSILEPGNHEHTLIIYYDDCRVEEVFSTEIRARLKLQFPNIILQDRGDAINNSFMFESNDPNLMIDEFVIMDRWGNVVHSANNKLFSELEPWKGTLAGQNVLPGVYIYQVQYTDAFGKKGVRVGDITVID